MYFQNLTKSGARDSESASKGKEVISVICPKCGCEAAGNFCSNCGALLENRALERERENDGEKWERLKLPRDTGGADVSVRETPEYRDPENGRDRKREKPEKSARSRARDGAKRQSRSSKKEKKEEAAKEKAARKIRRQLEKRIETLEEEQSRERLLRERNAKQAAREKDAPQDERNGASPGEAIGNAAAKGITGAVVLLSRVMQILCALCMAGMVWMTGRAFWYGRKGLGSVAAIAAEENYGLALYLCAAGVTLFLGVVWCLWILSRKASGGGVRMKTYDTGRGLIPFLLCIAAVYAALPASALLPADKEAFHGLVRGAAAVLEAVNANHEFLAFSSTAGAVLSLIRRLLRV